MLSLFCYHQCIFADRFFSYMHSYDRIGAGSILRSMDERTGSRLIETSGAAERCGRDTAPQETVDKSTAADRRVVYTWMIYLSYFWPYRIWLLSCPASPPPRPATRRNLNDISAQRMFLRSYISFAARLICPTLLSPPLRNVIGEQGATPVAVNLLFSIEYIMTDLLSNIINNRQYRTIITNELRTISRSDSGAMSENGRYVARQSTFILPIHMVQGRHLTEHMSPLCTRYLTQESEVNEESCKVVH